MKKLLIICGLLFSVVTFASAQGQGGNRGGTPEERIKRSTDQLVEKLKLTDEQKTKATEVFTAQIAAMTKIREEAAGDRAVMMEKSTKLNTETEAKINAFLTDDQKKAYKTMLDEQKAAREKMMKERAAGGGTGK
ncbi:MAG: hypothetical protein V4663_14320 [Bacteroidota bacterium]